MLTDIIMETVVAWYSFVICTLQTCGRLGSCELYGDDLHPIQPQFESLAKDPRYCCYRLDLFSHFYIGFNNYS